MRVTALALALTLFALPALAKPTSFECRTDGGLVLKCVLDEAKGTLGCRFPASATTQLAYKLIPVVGTYVFGLLDQSANGNLDTITIDRSTGLALWYGINRKVERGAKYNLGHTVRKGLCYRPAFK